MNPYGHFDDKNKQYVITRPDTPLPWINYLGSNGFYGIVSNTAGGYAFYQDAKLRRLTRYRYNNVPLDANGRYIYIKDGDTIWNPMWKPMKTSLDKYECRHGMGYTTIRGEKDGIAVTVTYFIPNADTVEIWDVQIENNSGKEKNIRLWGFVEWCLWDAMDDMTNFQRNFSIGQVEIENNTIFHKTEYRERRNHFAYFYSSEPVSGYDTARDAFVGVHQGFYEPKAVLNGECTNSHAHGWAPIAAQQIDVSLKDGESKRLSFILGYAENPVDDKFTSLHVINKKPFETTIVKYNSPEKIDAAFADLCSFWESLFTNYQAETENEHVNRMVNIWNQYQCMTTFNMSRSASFYESGIGRGMGYRDSNQDVLGFVHIIPDRARQRILDIAATQLSDGTCYHQYQPLTKKGNSELGGGFNDDPLWLILSTASYIKETGDFNILHEKIGYADVEQKTATLLDHLEISIEYTMKHRGPHSLPLIGHADWNDCLNLNCFSDQPGESFQLKEDSGPGNIAESLMIAGQFCAVTLELAEIYNELDLQDKAQDVLAKRQEMESAILAGGWDGEWFLRAYDAFGQKIGSSECEDGKIFIESQGWCILGHVGFENGFAQKALDSVKQHLSSPNGIILQQPAYQTYHIELGEVSSYPPGYKENAGIFTHNNTWIQIAEALMGNGNQAFEYYMSICPSIKEEQIETYRAEPYVYSQMTAGPDAVKSGEGKNSWLTGTASWTFVTIAQYILGIKPGYHGLVIDPCIPQEWNEYKVTRKFRGKTYKIHVINPNHVSAGVASIQINGNELEGNAIPLDIEGDIIKVKVELG